ncbi:MAG: hypothetical protein Q9214_007732, partial [Letrouitia sp. 1 TL-2023]
MSQIESYNSTSPEETTSPPVGGQTDSSIPSTIDSKSNRDTTSPPTRGNSASQPNPRSCITCRKRKVRCDKRHPCSNCNKAAIECIFPGPGRAPRRSRKPTDTELMARLKKLEGVVQSLGKNIDDEGEPAEGHDSPAATAEGETDGGLQQPKTEIKAPKNCGLFNGPDPQTSGTNGVVKEFGRLVVEEGRSRYVSNKFWNSLSEE